MHVYVIDVVKLQYIDLDCVTIVKSEMPQTLIS